VRWRLVTHRARTDLVVNSDLWERVIRRGRCEAAWGTVVALGGSSGGSISRVEIRV
jgi:hypothetical protein